MRGIFSYLVAGTLAVLALGMIVPSTWLGLSVGAWTVVEPGNTLQSVNRGSKSDRLVVPVTVVGKSAGDKSPSVDSRQQPPATPVKILEGCDPVFSPLSSGARANLPGRCAV